MADVRILGIVHANSPFITAYPWYNGYNWGPRLARAPNIFGSTAKGIAWSPDGATVLLTISSPNPNVGGYEFNGISFAGRVNSTYSPDFLQGTDLALSPDGTNVLFGGTATPYVAVIPFNNGYGIPYNNIGTDLLGTTQKVAWTTDGAYAAIGNTNSPFIWVFAWSNNTGWGAQVANPVTLPAGQVFDIAWSPDNAYVAVAHTTTPFISVYEWTGTAFGSKVANPSPLPAGNGRGVSWSPAGDYIAVAHVTSPLISVYEWTGTAFGSKVADPSTLPAGVGVNVIWMPITGNLITLATSLSPFLFSYKWNAGFGEIIPSPIDLPEGAPTRMAWSQVFDIPSLGALRLRTRLGTIPSNADNRFEIDMGDGSGGTLDRFSSEFFTRDT